MALTRIMRGTGAMSGAYTALVARKLPQAHVTVTVTTSDGSRPSAEWRVHFSCTTPVRSRARRIRLLCFLTTPIGIYGPAEHVYPPPSVVVPAAPTYISSCVALPRATWSEGYSSHPQPSRVSDYCVRSTHLLVCSSRRTGDKSTRMHTPPGALRYAGHRCRMASPCGAASCTCDPSRSQQCHGLRRGSCMPGAVSLHALRPQSL